MHLLVIAGEASGDRLAAWYVQKYAQDYATITAVGGPALAACNAQLVAPYNDIAVTGLVEVLTHLPALYTVWKKVCDLVATQAYDTI